MIQSLTYADLAELLGITAESANRLARRRRWPRTMGNDGRVRVTVPEGVLVRADSPPVSPGDGAPDSPPDNPVHALIARLEADLIEARTRAEAAEARIERVATEFAARDAAHAAQFAAERDRADRAQAELAAVADRLTEIVGRSWWRRLVG
jgi:hypothetical protein